MYFSVIFRELFNDFRKTKPKMPITNTIQYNKENFYSAKIPRKPAHQYQSVGQILIQIQFRIINSDKGAKEDRPGQIGRFLEMLIYLHMT